ncbi:hypothetical protein [Singulisphaera sp. PoT]|uniref:hypothetical protein n=1 Tax=Singulisphaera sp. PoT TaxID=3411797 RepID=UPI003BF4CBE2
MGRPKAARVSGFCAARSASSGLMALGCLAAFVLVLSHPDSASAQAGVRKVAARSNQDWSGSSGSWGEPDGGATTAPRPGPATSKPAPAPTAVTLTVAKPTRGSSYLFFMPKKAVASIAPVKPLPGLVEPLKSGNVGTQSAEKEAFKSPKAYSYMYFQPKPKDARGGAAGARPGPSVAKPKAKAPSMALGKGNGLPNPNYRPFLIYQPKSRPLSTSTSQAQKKTAR